MAVVALALAPIQALASGVMFYRGDQLVSVERATLGDSPTVKALVEALLAGPTADETNAGITTAIPAGTTIVDLQVAGDTVTVDLSGNVLQGIDEATLLGIYDQFRATLAGWPEFTSIRLTCKGNLLSTYLTPVTPVEGTTAARPLMNMTTSVGLAGKIIAIGPSHGRYWNGSGWYWQRSDPCGLGEAVLEDTNSIRLMQFLKQYLAQDGATVHVPREMNESNCCDSETGLAWWKVCAQMWLKAQGYPCSVWGNVSGSCGATTDTNRYSDDIRARPLFADYHGTDIYIACHTNAGGGTGTETFRDSAMEYPAHVANSLTLATAVQDNVISSIRELYDSSWASRGVKDSAGGFGEIRVPNRPACLIELAFHDKCDRDAPALTTNYFRSVAEWGLYRGVCQYFGTTPTWDRYSDEYVSDTIPATMTPGQSYTVGITFRNRGVVWSDANSFRLGAVGDSDPLTTSTRATISGEVLPGNTYTFTLTMTAPTLPGLYTTDWQMVRDGVAWFGPTLSKQVLVTGDDTAPVITNHPANQTVAGGATVVFTVDAGGTPPLSYQWQKNTVDLIDGGRVSGANTATLQITSADTVDNASYRCIVSNALGSQTSNSATLSVVMGASTWIVESRSGGQNWSTNFSRVGTFSDVTGKSTAAGCTAGIGHCYTSAVYSGRSATYTFTPGSTGSWKIYATWVTSTNGCPGLRHVITHAGGTASVTMNQTQSGTGNTWNLLGEYTLNAGTQYSVVQTTDSSTASGILRADSIKWERSSTIVYPPTITQQPTAASVCSGANATFTAAGSGTGTISYRWQKNNVNLNDVGHYSGVTTATLTITGADTTDVANYRCIVTNTGGSTPTSTVALTLKAATEITQQPTSQSILVGNPVTLSVQATGEGTLTYRWQKDGTDLADDTRITGSATASLNISAFAETDAGAYACVVTGGCGALTSGSATLTVQPPPAVPGDMDGDRDVDMEDFGQLQVCLTGPDEPQSDVACAKALLDSDDDVDDADVGLYIKCATAPGVQGNPNCRDN
jgi:N-acetylmuramoyl-L-alanine amidase